MRRHRTTADGGSPGRRFRGALRVPLLARRTLIFDSIRSFAFGILETGPKTFFLLIAVRHFGASDAVKTLVSLPQAFGLIAALLVIAYLARLPVRRNLVAAAAARSSGTGQRTAAHRDGGQ